MDKYKKLLHNSILFSIGSIGSKLILFFLVPLYTNALNTYEYGITDLITTSTNLAMPFLTLSINDAIIRFSISKDTKKEKVLKNSILVVLFGSILLVLCYPFVAATKLFDEYTMVFIMYTIIYQFRSAFSIYLQGADRIKIYTIDGLLYTFLLGILNVLFLVVLKRGLEGYLWALLIATIVSIVYQCVIGKIITDYKNAGSYDFTLLKQMLRYSLPLIANAVSWWVISSSDKYMLHAMRGTSFVGLYAVAVKMPALVTTFTTIISQAWLISSVTEYESGRDKQFFSNIFSLYATFLILAASGVILIIKPFMNVYVGFEFITAWIFVPSLLVAAIFKAVANYFMTFYKAEKKNIRELTVTMLCAISNIILNFMLIPHFDIMGACVATLISQGLIAVVSILDTRRFFSFSLDLKVKLPCILILIAQLLFVSNNILPIQVSMICLGVLILLNWKTIRGIYANIGKSIHM